MLAVTTVLEGPDEPVANGSRLAATDVVGPAIGPTRQPDASGVGVRLAESLTDGEQAAAFGVDDHHRPTCAECGIHETTDGRRFAGAGRADERHVTLEFRQPQTKELVGIDRCRLEWRRQHPPKIDGGLPFRQR